MTDEQLVELNVADRRAMAFRRLADEHLDASYRLAYAILHDAADAQDATHDAFVTAWRRWSTLRDPARFEAWFDRILVNTCRHRIRDRARYRSRDLSAVEANAAPDVHARAEARDLISEAVGALSPEHQVVLALRYARDLTVHQIASRLGIRAGTVKSRLHYALRRLHDRIDETDRKRASR